MENSFLTQQGLAQLLQETTHCLEKMDEGQAQLMSTLVYLSPFFNLKTAVFTFGADFEASWKIWKNELKNFLFHLEEAQAAYQELSGQMQNILTGRSAQDPLFQELARQGNLLTKDLQKRQELAKHLIDLGQVLDRVMQQEKMTPQQKQKIEDLVFRLQLLF